MNAALIDPALAWHVAGSLGFCCAFIVVLLVRKILNTVRIRLPLPSVLSRFVLWVSLVGSLFAAARVIGADGTKEASLAFLIGGAIGLWSAIAFEPRLIGSQKSKE